MKEIEIENESRNAEKQNVRLTVINRNEDEDTYEIDLAMVWEEAKRCFAVWLCVAIGVGAISGAVALVAQKYILTESVQSLVSFASGANYDIRKIKSPTVVELAMEDRNMDLRDLEIIRNAIEIKGVIPDRAVDKMSMYYGIMSQGGINAVESILDTSYGISRYIISFDYFHTGYSQEEGIDFMNALLRAYQEYFTANYNYNEAMGNTLMAIDYRNYDYAEAINIFSTTLDNLSSYLSSVETSETAAFRSTETGLTFQDIRRTASTIQDNDLDRASSYIMIHSVSANDAPTQIAYYEWLIENLTQKRAVQRTRMASLTNSIENYEKDPVLIAVQDGNSVVTSMEDLNANYDSMITQMLETQATIASYNRSISYYESVIEGFRNASGSSPRDIEIVEGYLESLNVKMNVLLNDASRTVNEYYERMAFANRIQVLVPATNKPIPIISVLAIKIVVITQFVIICAFGCVAFFKGMRATNSKKEQNEFSD